jgi:hypothetical protein
MSDQAATVISRLLTQRAASISQKAPPGQPHPLYTWPERAGTTVDIGTLRRRYPHSALGTRGVAHCEFAVISARGYGVRGQGL